MRRLRNIFVIFILLVLVSCAKTAIKGSPGWVGYRETGKASYYAMKYDQDKLEISGINMELKYFEDIADGERLDCQSVLMTRESIIDFAKKYDPQPFHIDEMSANESIFNGLVASSLHTLSACTRVVVEAQGELAILSGVGMHEAKMFNPVRPGDTLTVEAWWTELKRSKSKPDRGFASIKCKITNQREEPIVEYGYRYLLACKGLKKQ